MIAEIITVSKEILLGEQLNSSAKYISKELSILGIDINRSTVTDYDKSKLQSLFNEALSRSDIVIILGGLGVYKSNLTKDVVAKKYNEPLFFNQEMYLRLVNNLKAINKYNVKVTRALLTEAYVLKNSINLVCKYSTTSGFIYNSRDNKHVICLPIENKELISMYLSNVKPYLMPRVSYYFESYSFFLKHATEVDLYNLLKQEMLKSTPKVEIEVLSGYQKVSVTCKARTKEEAKLLLDKKVLRLRVLLKNYI